GWTTAATNQMTGSPVYVTPAAVGEPLIIFTCSDQRVRAAFAANGTVLWAKVLNYEIKGPVTVHNEVAYVATMYNALYALRVADGSQVWMANTVLGSVTYAGPVVSAVNQAVYLGTVAGVIQAFSMNNGSLLWQYSTAFPDVETMGVLSLDESTLYFASNAAGSTGNSFYRTAQVGALNLTGTSASIPVAQRLIWSVTDEFGTVMRKMARSGDGSFLIVTARSEPNLGNGRVYKMDTATGARLWQTNLTGCFLSGPALYEEAGATSLVIVHADNWVAENQAVFTAVALYVADGSQAWMFEDRTSTWNQSPFDYSPIVVGNMSIARVVVIPSSSGALHGFDLAGNRLWTVGTTASFYRTPISAALITYPNGCILATYSDFYLRVFCSPGTVPWPTIVPTNAATGSSSVSRAALLTSALATAASALALTL
ncbi:hypothetical protein EON62_01735, partial [archaeon]